MEEKKRSVLIEELFHAALALDPSLRAAFLDRSCGSDRDLRTEVQNLISMHQKPGSFLDSPAYEVGGVLLREPRASSLIGKSLGHYEILESIGAGGMGEVYRARDTHLDRSVAIKVLPAEAVADPERKRRFVQEAKSASALNHPGIVTIHDISRSDGIDFIAMEYIAGKTLNQLIRRKGLPINEALRYGVQIADALAAAHAAGIVHRDLKPANVMVTEKGLIKVLDFGLAKLTESAQGNESGTTLTMEPVTEEGTIVGTVAYMSPEQAEGKKIDARSDIFSFGSLLYEMISGQRAFQGDSKISTLSAILNKDPAPLTTDIPRDVEKVLTRCLRKDPTRRFQTTADLKVSLEELREESESGKRRRSSTRRGTSSLAILPFENVGEDPNLDYLSDGIAESLTNSLSRLPKLRVIPRTRAFRYRGEGVDPVRAGRELDVRVILTGRVSVRGDNLNLQIDLIDVDQDSQLWGEQYGRSLSDILTVQDDIVRAISDKLRLNPSGEERRRMVRRYTDDTEAYQFYLKGRYYWDKRTVGMLKKAAEQFRQALEKDPTYALAYAGLAEAYAVYAVYNVTSPDQAVPLARAAVREALRMDDTIAEAHTALAFIRMTYDFDLAGAEEEFRRAIELNPDHPTAHFWHGLYHIARRQDDAAIAKLRRAQEAAPLSLNVNSYVGWALMAARRTDQAVEQLRKTLDIDPNFPNAHLFLGMCYEQQGFYQEALQEIQKARDLSGGNLLMIGALGHAFGSAGLRAEANEVLAEMTEMRRERYVASLDFAYVHSSVRDREKTLYWLERAWEERSAWLLWIGVDPRLDWLQSEPQFIDLLRRMNLAVRPE